VLDIFVDLLIAYFDVFFVENDPLDIVDFILTPSISLIIIIIIIITITKIAPFN